MGNSKTVLAIDSGGFKTDVVIVKYSGDEIEKRTRCSCGPLNVATTDATIWQPKLVECFEEVVASFDGFEKIDVAMFSITGVGDDDFRSEIELWARERLGIDDVVVMSDIDMILAIGEAMTEEEEAIVAINAGAGSVALGLDVDSETVIRAGGWGHLLGDEGSGYWIGREAIRSVMKAGECGEKQSELHRQILNHVGLDSAHDLIGYFSRAEDARYAIADLASVVVDAMKAGDDVATKILHQAASELNELAKKVIVQLDVKEYVLLVSGYFLCEIEEFCVAFAELFSCWKDSPTDIYYIDDPVMLAAALAARIE